MKKIMNIKINQLLKGIAAVALIGTVFSCSEDFLKPEPLSVFEPELTYTTEPGIMATLARADRHLRSYWTYWQTRNQNLPIMTDYMFSDLAVHGKTDNDGIFIDIATRLTPRDGWYDDDDRNRLRFFWDETYKGISYANAVTTYIDQVDGLSEEIKNEYKGRAYFHRAFRYLALCFEFKDVPLVTKLPSAPKFDYRSTKREAILEMITLDMEKAVQWVPDQVDMTLMGMINKGACRQLLIKCYLATGQWDKAIAQADTLINLSGYSLMEDNFGTFIDPSPATHPITRNVIWDLHRWQNKSIPANKEVILTMPNREGTTSAIKMRSMRNLAPNLDNGAIRTPNGATGTIYYAPSNSKYRTNLDYKNAYGRGQGMIRPTYYATNSMWVVNGVNDEGDLRHNSAVGNWMRMDSVKYNDPANTEWFGKNLILRNTDGSILCTDTIRCWFDWPHYKTWVEDPDQQNNLNEKACNGGAGDWYCYRLAETYLLRAEAKFYKGDIAGATNDVNRIRSRAHATQLYSTVTIGDIMAERARELYMEEWRFTELSRVSYCLALSGRADEWGNTYTVDNLSADSYWFQRIEHYNNFYNKDKVQVKGRSFTMRSENINWPIPYWAIDANRDAQLHQNPGYDGYDASIPVWETWEDAVADEF
jgi:hypothetical protein